LKKKPKNEDHENLDRWLVSYADFITLLFTFFVMMYAVSSLNKGTYRVISSAIMDTFKHRTPRQHLHVIIPHSRTMAGKAAPDTLSILHQAMQLILKKALHPGLFAVDETKKNVRLRIQAGFLFKKGHARVRKAALPTLRRIARVLSQAGHPIRVEGHTDNTPIRGRYPNNWALSAARAVNILSLLVSMGPLDPEKTSTVAYGDSRPLVPNDTPEHRRQNRRVEIVILKKPSSSLPKPSADIFNLPAPRI